MTQESEDIYEGSEIGMEEQRAWNPITTKSQILFVISKHMTKKRFTYPFVLELIWVMTKLMSNF
jgi:hypothetical protein